ncbi:hypothetical protein K7X08_021218 [Anisodus acutangulus]|uniref:Uncharacterized protein n=1 Tax=Anisodus acutangulus TaxID=402998 RepID=A0A9Q1RAL5_9SOLA|nr:hypothetical protein K7X08_021218 [Anisodus acutangulus]
MENMSSNMSDLLEKLQQMENEWSSFTMYSISCDARIPKILRRIDIECDSLLRFFFGYSFSENYCHLGILQIEKDWGSFLVFSNEYRLKLSHLCETVRSQRDSFKMLLDDDLFLEESDPIDTLQQRTHNFLKTSLLIREECDSFLVFVEKYLFLEEIEALQKIRYECDSFNTLSKEYRSSLDGLKLLKRDFKFLDIILNSQIFIDDPNVRGEVHVLFQGAAADVVQMYPKPVTSRHPYFHHCILNVQSKFRKTKFKIRAKYSFPKLSFQLLANKDGNVVPNLVMEFIDTVTENLSNLLKVNDPSSLLCVGGLMDQIKKALKELKVLRSFVYFLSHICIEPQGQQTFFSHALEVAWHTIMVTWLYFRSDKYGYLDSDPDEEYPLFSDVLRSDKYGYLDSDPDAEYPLFSDVLRSDKYGYLDSDPDEEYPLFDNVLRRKIQPIEPNICKLYIDALQALKLVKSQRYPVTPIIDCEVGLVETLLLNLEELPSSSNCATIKSTLQEMLNILRTNLINLPTEAFEFYLRDIDSVIIDSGLLVYSLIGNKHENEVAALGETSQAQIQSMKEIIYFITQKSYFLRSNLPKIDGLGSTCFVLDNLQEFIGCHLDSASFRKSQLQTIQKKIKYFQKVVEQHNGLQHFATQVMGLVYEVEYIIDACKEEVPDWCLSLWMLHIIEDINLLMKEVEDKQEIKVSDLVLHNTTIEAASAHNPQFASNPSRNDEMVGFKDVMVEIREKLLKGSLHLDVISIVGMPGLGKTTLANELYFDESIVSYFEIHAQCCVSQEYKRKVLLLDILRDITDETDKLDEQDDHELADLLRKLLMRKRYLVLIDDVWETSAWDDLRSCFPEDNRGSRIILTTRHYGVASHAKHNSDPHNLRFLNSDEGWMLLNNKVFNNESCPLILRDVGQEIVRKCGGLPLSIILIAGILTRMKKEKHCWEQVATNLGPNIQVQSEHTLDLSYQTLPHYLKPLFLYLGVFPEDREIQVSKLTWLWIAEGFIETHAKKLSEDIARSYLENLIGRNLVMVAKKSFDGKIKACRIHDLVLEFCRKKASSENFLEKIKGDRGPDRSCTPKCNTSRRLSFYSRCDSLEKWCLSFSHVKSFQFREARNIAFSSIDLASDTFKRFKFLRVLDFEFTVIDSFPQELILLRYLAFRTAEDTISLPANLRNLETLIVQGVRGRVSLPDTIWKMVKLRHLHIYDQVFFTLNIGQEFSQSTSTMDDLQTISSACFSCVDDADKILAKTPNLQKLRCEVSKFDGSFPAFNTLSKLEMLKISSGTRLTLVNQMKFPSKLKKLTLSNFHIHLSDIATLPELEVLKLLRVNISSNIWEVNDEQFLQLKFLKLENLSFSDWHASDDAFPCLEHLVLKKCPYLKVIPSRFEDTSCLKSVEIISCDKALTMSAKAVSKTLEDMLGTYGFKIVSDF